MTLTHGCDLTDVLTTRRFAKVCSETGRSSVGILVGQDREPMAREPGVALLMTASGSLDIFLTRLLRMKLFL